VTQQPGLSPDGAPPPRLDALDALRGFAILMMALSGVVPRGQWPAWMYHAQLPPPDHVFNPAIPGLTWVDLVFPFFLFALGAAIPLALERRLRAGVGPAALVRQTLQRGLLLLGFAVYVQHINPWWLAARPTPAVWLHALLGFAVLFPILTRLPARWPPARRALLRLGGLAGAAAVCLTLPYPAGQHFDALRSDIIIVVLANVAVWGTLIWLVTRGRPVWRVGVLLLLVALRLAHEPAGWVQDFWNLRFLPEAVRPLALRYAQPYYCQYLHIVLPGTIAGDLLCRRLYGAPGPAPRAASGLVVAGLLGLALNVLVTVGLQARWVVATALGAAGLCGLGLLLLWHPRRRAAGVEPRLFAWATFCLAVGLVLEAHEGGIRKDPSTLSYYYVTAGLALFALLAFMLAGHWLGRRPLALLIDSGQNPMIAYVGIRNLVPPVLGLLALLPPVAWLFDAVQRLGAAAVGPAVTGLLRAVLLTLLVGLATLACTRRRWFWRT
jgi:predicted acyltransferase